MNNEGRWRKMSYATMGDISYASTYLPHAPKVGIGDSYWANPWPIAQPAEPHMPVPGWGFTPNLAGRERIGVGDTTTSASTTMQSRYLLAPLLVGAIVYFAMPEKKALYGALGALATLIVSAKLESSGA
jgi:hypothetical protein